ncbi:MAG: hypothetical protein Ta2A_13600 [Treponemataceae bacterium]|nr:MAG: hypothetical protein Ta2A_13600 [Treponemataceae bacterium]
MNKTHVNFRVPLTVMATTLIFFLMNVFTPKIADDFYWENISGSQEKVESISDIFPSIYNYYMATDGTAITGCRVFAVFVTQLNVLLGKPLFNVANALVYTFLILLMYFHITGGIKNINIFLYGTINILIWYLLPSWGEDFLWLTGSCFYVWPIVVILLFLAPLRKKADNAAYNMTFPLSVFYLPLGILSGLSYENAGAAVFFLLIGYYVTKAIKKEKIIAFEILGTIGFLIGFILLMAAPGNYSRLNSYEIVQRYGFIARTAIRLFYTTQTFFGNHGALLTGISIILCIETFYHQKKAINYFSLLYLLAGIVSAYSMILSPIFMDRVFFPVTIFLIIATLNLFVQIEKPMIIRRNSKYIFALVLVLFSFSLFKAGIAIHKSYIGDKTLNVSEKHYGQMH